MRQLLELARHHNHDSLRLEWLLGSAARSRNTLYIPGRAFLIAHVPELTGSAAEDVLEAGFHESSLSLRRMLGEFSIEISADRVITPNRDGCTQDIKTKNHFKAIVGSRPSWDCRQKPRKSEKKYRGVNLLESEAYY